MIAFNINAHGIENGKPREFYRDYKSLHSYPGQGVWSKDSYYFKGVFLRVMRALDYVKSLPEWDGRNLFVRGASQGGAQSIVAAAMDRQVTFCFAAVPALCDHNACLAGRKPGWPALVNVPAEKLNSEKKFILGVLRYYDIAYFAKRIGCESCLSVGLLDFTCPPTSVFAAYNNLPGSIVKSLQINPAEGHGGSQDKLEIRFREIVERCCKNAATFQ
ncbi:MAG: acetylxylan esterase [Victivallales bacterium]|nr:acetylxylan esterase [Victivallales bacterium]